MLMQAFLRVHTAGYTQAHASPMLLIFSSAKKETQQFVGKTSWCCLCSNGASSEQKRTNLILNPGDPDASRGPVERIRYRKCVSGMGHRDTTSVQLLSSEYKQAVSQTCSQRRQAAASTLTCSNCCLQHPISSLKIPCLSFSLPDS
jgi:hypothetical protein